MKIYLTRRMVVLLALGISSGLPLALIAGTLQAWMTDEGISLKVLGTFAFVTLPSAFKFCWSPLLDRFDPPFLGSLGRRQSWMAVCQVTLALLFLMLAHLHPSQDLTLFFILSLAIGFVSASQDIVIDAYRAEVLPTAELGAGAGVAIFGYRLGMLLSGAFALYLSQYHPWSFVYSVMAALQASALIATLAAPQPRDAILRPANIVEAFREPLLEFWRRSHAGELVAFVLLYKIGDVMAAMFSTRFLLEIGFLKTEIAAVSKGLGLAATILGSMIGGAWMVSLGIRRSLLGFGVVQASSIIAFAVLAMVGNDRIALMVAIGLENLGSGLGTAAFTAYLTSLCDKRFTATQYALLTSLAAVTRSALGTPLGFLADNVGWTYYFLLCAAMSTPALLLVYLRFDRWSERGDSNAVV